MAGSAVVLAAGLVQAQPQPQPQSGDQSYYIGNAVGQPVPQPTTPTEEPPPAPGETPVIIPPTEPGPPVVAPPVEEREAPASHPASKPSDSAEAKSPEDTQPGVRQRHGAAVIQALDKITAETMRFEVKVGRPVRYKGLVFTLRSCETSAPDEPMSDSMAYLEVRDEPRAAATEDQPSRQVFAGWMFASSPDVNPLGHPVYDAWLIACKA